MQIAARDKSDSDHALYYDNTPIRTSFSQALAVTL